MCQLAQITQVLAGVSVWYKPVCENVGGQCLYVSVCGSVAQSC